eukprot:CAMPEP_0116862452 /NCGR_PEP_ID=MMETSP0418-20121206/23643_1 /TAXON_ID=1158023 /ORGANISM="Astrosyne radiata, Strain 13vi08-1A" /LENGTH=95 /DNA_ID=CAMNT_0004497301 /DNA_START=264 /DNA_END=548 /DNA_ORIENTATION=+
MKKDGSGATVRFRPIIVGHGCVVDGMLGPGVTLGEEASVELLSVVPEGAKVPECVVARGNPAVGAGRAAKRSANTQNEWLMDMVKGLWLILELLL